MSCIYEMKPLYEDLKRGGKDWYKLKWKPIKNGTYNLWIEKTLRSWKVNLLGIRYYKSNAHNGWGRSWDGFAVEIGFIFFTIHFWIHYNYCVHKDGPQDVANENKRPLNLTDLRGGRNNRAEYGV